MKLERIAICDQQQSIRYVLREIDQAGSRLAVIVDSTQRLIGLVSDGDIRRGLLGGVTLDDRINEITNRTPYILRPDSDLETLIAQASAKRIELIPEVDQTGRFTQLVTLDEIRELLRLPNLVVIMAGGLGLRLRPLTNNTPKPMLRIAGKPILQLIIESLKEQGFSRFVFSIGYLGEQVIEHFGDGKLFGSEINYISEASPLGTAGALKLLNHPPADPFFVMNGDILHDIDLRELLRFHKESETHLTIALRRHETRIPYGVVSMEKETVVGIQEKPTFEHLINTGVYVTDARILEFITPGERVDMPELASRLLDQGERICGYRTESRWLDIGHLEEFSRAQREWSKSVHD